MIGTFFSGNGADDTGELLTFLDVPFGNGFGNWFYEHQDLVIEAFRKYGNVSIEAAIKEEVDATLRKKHNMTYEEWQALPADKRFEVGIAVSFDMG